MWGVTDESSENPLAELWGLFKRDDDVSWQHKALCSQTQCEVREQCLEWAIDHDERFGIWGGMSERERRRYKKEHKERA